MKLQFACLLLVLFFATVLSQKPNINSLYNKFKNQHIISNMTESNCTAVMQGRKISNAKKCKNTNTFILSNAKTVKAICGDKGQPYGKLTKSIGRFYIVVCKVKKQQAKPAKCLYQGEKLNKKIIIKCEKSFPVHYDGDIDYCNWAADLYLSCEIKHIWWLMFCVCFIMFNVCLISKDITISLNLCLLYMFVQSKEMHAADMTSRICRLFLSTDQLEHLTI